MLGADTRLEYSERADLWLPWIGRTLMKFPHLDPAWVRRGKFAAVKRVATLDLLAGSVKGPTACISGS